MGVGGGVLDKVVVRVGGCVNDEVLVDVRDEVAVGVGGGVRVRVNVFVAWDEADRLGVFFVGVGGGDRVLESVTVSVPIETVPEAVSKAEIDNDCESDTTDEGERVCESEFVVVADSVAATVGDTDIELEQSVMSR